MRIVLTGFMGCGKTTLGKMLAEQLGYPFYDTDEMIVERLNLSIEEIFAQFGEDFFRYHERQVLFSLSEAIPAVIATGGGTLLLKENLDLLRKQKSLIIFLKVSPEILWQRVKNSSRPLAKERKSFFQLYQIRNRVYRQLENQLQLPGRDLDSDFQSLLKFLSREQKGHQLCLREKSCEVHFLRSLWGLNRERLSAYFSSGKVFLISDCWLNNYFQLSKIFPHWQHLSLKGNENNKNLKTVTHIWKWLLENQIERHDNLLAFGGGVLSDLTGFAAATILRGVKLSFIPSTLLAMADAAIGGKNGFDFQKSKNMIGTFYLPDKIFIDSTLLITLSPEQMLDGLIEIVKAGLLADQPLLDLIDRKKQLFLQRDLGFLEQIIFRAIKIKLAFLKDDLKDLHGQRVMLNLGHTFGHALERVSKFKISHGRAVGYGILFSLLLARRLKFLNSREMQRAADYLISWLKPLKVDYPFETIIQALRADKKIEEGKMRWVLLSAIGSPQLVKITDKEVLRQTYKELLQWPF